MKTTPDFTTSSGNVFADLGMADAEERLAKAELARQIGSIIEHRHLTQTEAASVLGTTQPKLSELLKGRLAGFSMERLIRFLVALDRDVVIVVSRKPRNHAKASVSVAGPSATQVFGGEEPVQPEVSFTGS